MKRTAGLIISTIMIFLASGCMDNNNSLLTIKPNLSNPMIEHDVSSEEGTPDSGIEIEEGKVSEKDEDSSLNDNEKRPSSEMSDWSNFY